MKKRKLAAGIAIRLLCIAMALVFLAPFYISVVYSFKTRQQITFTGLQFPREFHFENYANVLADSDFYRALLNSVATTVPTVALLTVICPMASYVLARNTKKGYNLVYSLFLAALLIPYQSVMLPIYTNLRGLGLLNTFTGNVLVKTGFQISISILICTGFIKSISRELEEAAYIDGLGRPGAFFRIVFPLLGSVMLSLLIINALFAWNDFQLSTVTLLREQVQTLPQMLYRYFGVRTVDLNEAFAAFTLSMLPLVVLYLLLQKYITSGVMAGAVKG